MTARAGIMTSVERGGRAGPVAPTIGDSEVLQFCKTGLLTLEAVIPESTNQWVRNYLETGSDDSMANAGELVREDRFAAEVLLHPEVAGVCRALLGAGFQLPDWMANHRLEGPMPVGRWHIDGGSRFERTCELLQVFYLPQTVTPEMGPTLFLPGSHLVPIAREELDHYGHLAGQVSAAAPAGSVFFTAYSIWHRQSEKPAPGVRNLLKWVYWRTQPPRRDWLPEPGFDPARADYSYVNGYFLGSTRKWQSVPRVAEMFTWMCGRGEEFRQAGGSGWPYSVSDPGLRKPGERS